MITSGFRLISRFEPVFFNVTVANGVAINYGQAVKFASGAITPCGPTDPVAAIAQQTVLSTAPNGSMCKVIFVDPTQIWQAPYVNTAAGGFVVGANAVAVNVAGTPTGALVAMNVDASTVSSGALAILQLDTVNLLAWVSFKSRQLS